MRSQGASHFLHRLDFRTHHSAAPLVEAGSASGREPTERIRLQSYVGQYLQETGVSLGTDDEGPFEMRLLHFRRTFVEKMFAIHGKVDAYQKTGREIGGYARHYYDYDLRMQRQFVSCAVSYVSAAASGVPSSWTAHGVCRLQLREFSSPVFSFWTL